MALSQKEQKDLVSRTAIDTLITEHKIYSGMKIGLGTGSTAMPAVRRLAERIADGSVRDIKAVATSFQTQLACEELGIPVFTMNDRAIDGALDLAIDGADEIDEHRGLIKGGGAALLREKIIAYNSAEFVIVADESKTLSAGTELGHKFAVPVEIIPEARVPVVQTMQKLGATCVLREGVRKAGPVITDNGNMILDCLWTAPIDWNGADSHDDLEHRINAIVGVVECGFFLQMKEHTIVFVSHADGSVEVRRP